MKKRLQGMVRLSFLGLIASLTPTLALAQVTIPNLEQDTPAPANEPIQVAPPHPAPAPPQTAPGGRGNPLLEGDIRDIKGIVSIPHPWRPYLLGSAILALALLLGWLLSRLLKRKKERGKTPALLPYDQALEDLRATRPLLEAGRDKAFSIAVSDAVRHFLEGQFKMPAPELTTEEFLHRIQGHELIKEKLADSFSEFLWKCDMAKFARQSYGLSGMEELYHNAEQLIEETYLKHKMRTVLLGERPRGDAREEKALAGA